MDFLTTYAVPLGSIAAIIVIIEFTLKPIRKLFAKKTDEIATITASNGGVVNTGTARDIKTSFKKTSKK